MRRRGPATVFVPGDWLRAPAPRSRRSRGCRGARGASSGCGTGSPSAGSPGDGMSPLSTIRRRVRSARASGTGTAESSAVVYGCSGRRYSSSDEATSTILPRYITATRSAMWRTTARSWAMNRYVRLNSRLEALEQVDDLGLDRHVEGRDRLVADDQVRLDRERAGDPDALALAAGELVRIALDERRVEADEAQQLLHPLASGAARWRGCGSRAARTGSSRRSGAGPATSTGPGTPSGTCAGDGEGRSP